MSVSPLYKEIAKKQVFSIQDVLPFTKSNDVASVYLNRMTKKGLIRKVRKNLYVALDLSSGGDLANKYQIASHINDSSFLSYHSAFEFYGMYNQVYDIVQVSSPRLFSNFQDEGLTYQCFKTETLQQVDKVKGVNVCSIERTIVDSINKLGVSMSIEELLQCLSLVNIVDENKLLEMLSLYDKDVLYRKTGYLLASFKDQYRLSDDFFKTCKEKSNIANITKISSHEGNNLEFVKEWGLYGYKNIMKLISEWGDLDV